MAAQKNVKKDAAAVQETKAVETKAAAPAAEAKAEAPVAEPKAAPAKKTARTAAKRAVKAAAPAPEKLEELVIQSGVMEWKGAELMERAKAAYAAEGHRISSIKSLSMYVKPEERKAYYVVNEKTTGSIDL